MEKWFIKNKRADFSLIAQQFGISEVAARLIVNRGISSNEELKKFLHPEYSNMHSPSLLKDIEEAADILVTKIKNQEKIRVVGDYDVDGVIATYILTQALRECKANVDYEIPDRIKDGYGINQSIIEQAHNDQVDTIVTCDNGIAAVSQVAYAKSLGITVLITDHHDIPYNMDGEDKIYQIPPADAVVNPKQEDCGYPFEGICGATVAYKLVEVLFDKLNVPNGGAKKYLEFVAIATVCDVMDLVGENRIIVKLGLDAIRQTDNLGLLELIHANQLSEDQINTYHLGFILGPCINASGRLDSAKLGLRMLLTDSKEEAASLAKNLKILNDERKELTNQGVEAAIRQIEELNYLDYPVLVVYLEDCHESIAGIIAGRIKERYNRPTIVLTKGQHGVKGSARSIEEYNMFEGLTECKELLTKFGGHPMAAGLSLEENNVPVLREMLNQKSKLSQEDLARKVSFDMVLSPEQVNILLIQEFSILEPYGKGNVKPTFVVQNVQILRAYKLGQNRKVLKLTMLVPDGGKTSHTAMIFSDVEEFERRLIDVYGEEELTRIYQGANCCVSMDMVYYPDINEYNGYQNIQFIIQNYRFVH